MTRKEAFNNRPMLHSLKEGILIDQFITKIFDELEAENKELKEKLEAECWASELKNQTVDVLKESLDNTTIELSAYEDKKVAEFSGELYLYNGDDWLNNIENLVSAHLRIDKTYRVIILEE
jgi:hypothetical protein